MVPGLILLDLTHTTGSRPLPPPLNKVPNIGVSADVPNAPNNVPDLPNVSRTRAMVPNSTGAHPRKSRLGAVRTLPAWCTSSYEDCRALPWISKSVSAHDDGDALLHFWIQLTARLGTPRDGMAEQRVQHQRWNSDWWGALVGASSYNSANHLPPTVPSSISVAVQLQASSHGEDLQGPLEPFWVLQAL